MKRKKNYRVRRIDDLIDNEYHYLINSCMKLLDKMANAILVEKDEKKYYSYESKFFEYYKKIPNPFVKIQLLEIYENVLDKFAVNYKKR